MIKNNGNLGESGCVNWMFEKKGIFTIDSASISEDKVLEIFDLDIEDIVTEEDCYEIITTPESFSEISKYFENKNIPIEGKISLIPQNVIKVNNEIGDKAIKLISILEEHEDVQNIHSNFEIE